MASENRAPRLISIAQCADQLSVSEKTVRRWLASGQLHACRLGGQVRIADHEIMRLIRQNPYSVRA